MGVGSAGLHRQPEGLAARTLQWQWVPVRPRSGRGTGACPPTWDCASGHKRLLGCPNRLPLPAGCCAVHNPWGALTPPPPPPPARYGTYGDLGATGAGGTLLSSKKNFAVAACLGTGGQPVTHVEGGDRPAGAGVGVGTGCPCSPHAHGHRAGAVPVGTGDGGEAPRWSVAGRGLASSCASVSVAVAAGQEQPSTPVRSNPAQPVPPGSRLRHWLLFPAGALGTMEFGTLRWRAGRRGRVAGTTVGMLTGPGHPGPKPGA